MPPKQKYELPPESSHELPHGQEEISDALVLASLGIEPDEDALWASLAGNEGEPFQFQLTTRLKGDQTTQRPRQDVFDFFSKLSVYPEIVMELATHLRIRHFVSLYSISKDFHEIINGHMMHVMKRCALKRAPECDKIFQYRLYRSLCIPDPVGRTLPDRPDEIRMIPSLKWLQMIYHRERVVRDILALLAREGHRCPKGMSLSLKKMWLVMDISTSKRRAQIMHNETLWTDVDLYNIQFFCVKLEMRFNDPIAGPGDDGLRRLLLGQRGLSVLWRVLRREKLKTALEFTRMAVRYVWVKEKIHDDLPIFGVPAKEIGIGHLEGWGKGRVHLYRPEELIMRESARRNLKLGTHLTQMMLWGYVDPVTKENIKVTPEEMYMSDDEEEEGGKRWSDVKNSGWKDPAWEKTEKKRIAKEEAREQAKRDKEEADAALAAEIAEALARDDDWEDEEEEDSEDLEEGWDLDDEFLDSMEVDDDGNFI